MTNTQIVFKDNDLISASYSLGVAEQRLIFLAIIEARAQDKLIDARGLLRIYAKRYEQQFSVEKHTAYEAMKRAVNGLYEAGFSYDSTDEATGKTINYKSRWVDKIGYADELGCVELTFSSDIIPLITRLDNCYTEYELKQVSNLQSEYAIRLYEIIIRWKAVGKTNKIMLNDLRMMLGVEPEQYKKMCNFKAKVLDHAIKQINVYTDIKADYEQHKQGKTITAFTFRFKRKPQAKVIDASGATDIGFIKMSDAQVGTFSSKLAALPELGSNAPMGASTAEYATMIAMDLLDPTKQKKYIKHLAKVGYQDTKKKAV